MSGRCTICAGPQAATVDELLAGGTSLRAVSRLTGHSRSALSRHSQHAQPVARRFGLISGEGGSDGTVDPLAAAFELAQRAKTTRERLRALEAIRAATKLRLKARHGDADDEDRRLMQANIAAAEDAYRDGETFEHQMRALQGLREAIGQRLDAERKPDAVSVPVTIADHAGEALNAPGATVEMDPAAYWDAVPQRFRDAGRYVVHRVVPLSFDDPKPHEITVREAATGALAWRSP